MNKILSKKQIDDLKSAAVLAFQGKESDLVHGFRVMRKKVQIAAVYWSENFTGNEIEVAVCDSRLTEAYKLQTVLRWIDYEKSLSAPQCNTHKNGSDWPIFGFSFEESLKFLKRCQLLRLGYLNNELLNKLNAAVQAQSPESAITEAMRVTLASLRPTKHHEIIDLVKKTGIDVSPWYVKQDGTPALAPRSNPVYCYNWGFQGNDKTSVICLWHNSLSIQENKIVFSENMREVSAQLTLIADNKSEETDVRSRSRSQAERANQIDVIVSEKWMSDQTLRVIINEGPRRSDEAPGKEASVVEQRELDHASWYVHDYDVNTGDLLLVRDTPKRADHSGQINSSNIEKAVQASPIDSVVENLVKETLPVADSTPPEPHYVDQFTIGSTCSAPQQESNRTEYIRNPLVRAATLARAKGICEFCGAEGFVTRAGTIYLETHHVVPLSEGGADNVYNVSALCPNDHREAHYGELTAAIREKLLHKLSLIYDLPITPRQ